MASANFRHVTLSSVTCKKTPVDSSIAEDTITQSTESRANGDSVKT